MEYLSDVHLENYQHIIKQIEDERDKNETLRGEISDLNKKITATGLTLKPDLARRKIFKVLVKIFDTIFEIYDLYSERISRQEIENLSEFRNRKFYLVETYVSRPFQEKIISENWMVTVRVENTKSCVNKSINLKNKVFNPVCVVVPFDSSTEESLVEVTVSWPSDSCSWPSLKIASLPIDISYHIDSSSGFKAKNDATLDLIHVSRLYNTKIPKDVLKQPVLEYKFPCELNARGLFEAIIKNCYYKFDPRKKSSFSSTDNVTTATFLAGGPNSANVKLDVATKILQIEATPQDLYKLKKFFFANLPHQAREVGKNTVQNLLDLKKRLLECEDDQSANDLVQIYNELRAMVL